MKLFGMAIVFVTVVAFVCWVAVTFIQLFYMM